MTDGRSRGITIASFLLAGLYLLAGGAKLGGAQVEQFETWGYPAWFQYLIGVGEVAAGASDPLPEDFRRQKLLGRSHQFRQLGHLPFLASGDLCLLRGVRPGSPHPSSHLMEEYLEASTMEYCKASTASTTTLFLVNPPKRIF